MPAPIRLMVFQGYRPGYGFYNSFGAETRPLLKRGAKGAAVKEAQQGLMNILQRSFRYGADGDFGGETERAVIEAQGMFGLPTTGVIDADTWTLILARPIVISGELGSTPRKTPDATTMDPVVPGTSGPGGSGPGRDDGDISVSGNTTDKNVGMMLGIGAALVIAAFVLRK